MLKARSALLGIFTVLMALTFTNLALAAAPPPTPVVKDVNTASAEQLMTVKGVGEKTAAKIIAEREANGPFKALEDVASRVKGVGEKTVQHFKDGGWVAVVPGAPAPGGN